MIRFDRDGDGKLSFEEFARLITPHGREYQVQSSFRRTVSGHYYSFSQRDSSVYRQQTNPV
jgi:hypothetical protein